MNEINKDTSNESASALSGFKEIRKSFKLISEILQKYGAIVLKFLLSEFSKLTAKDLLIGVAALVYWAFPIDFIPDFLPFIGFLDDIIVALLAVMKIISNPKNNLEADLDEKIRATSEQSESGSGDRSLEELYELLEKLKHAAPNLIAILGNELEKRERDATEIADDEEKVMKVYNKASDSMKKKGEDLTPENLRLTEEKIDFLSD